jgi:hypothetical protein
MDDLGSDLIIRAIGENYAYQWDAQAEVNSGWNLWRSK